MSLSPTTSRSMTSSRWLPLWAFNSAGSAKRKSSKSRFSGMRCTPHGTYSSTAPIPPGPSRVSTRAWNGCPMTRASWCLPKAPGLQTAGIRQLPILPVTVNGSRRILPKGELVVKPGKVQVVVGDPIETTGYTTDTVQELVDKTRKVVMANFDPKYTG